MEGEELARGVLLPRRVGEQWLVLGVGQHAPGFGLRDEKPPPLNNTSLFFPSSWVSWPRLNGLTRSARHEETTGRSSDVTGRQKVTWLVD